MRWALIIASALLLAASPFRHPPRFTVADLPSCSDGDGPVFRGVTDGASATDCSVGGGAFEVTCECKDGSYSALGSGGGGGSGDITAVGDCATGACFQSETARQVLAAPAAGGIASFRALVEADVSDLSHTTDTTLSQENVEDFAGALVADGTGTHTGIAVTYQDATGDVDLVIDHDGASNFVGAEHVDWAAASAGTIHATNYVDDDQPDTDGEVPDDITIASSADLKTAGSLQMGSLTAGSATCLAISSDCIYHDTDCDGTKDSGEEFIDHQGCGAASFTPPESASITFQWIAKDARWWDGETVSTLDDQSSANNDLTAAASPTLRFGTKSSALEFTAAQSLSRTLVSDLIDADAFSLVGVFYLDVNSTGTCTSRPKIWTTTGGWVGLSYGDSEICLFNWDTAYDTVSVSSISTGWHKIAARHTGGTLYLRVDDAAEVSVASGDTGSVAVATQIMPSTMAGAIAAFAFYDTGISSASVDTWFAEFDANYPELP